MKNQTIVILVLAFLLLLAGGAIVTLLVRQHKMVVENDSILKEKEGVIRQFQNKEKQWIAEKASADLTIQSAFKVYKDELQGLRKEMGFTKSELRELKNYVQVGFNVKDSGKSVVVSHYYPKGKGDSIQVKEFAVTDTYLDFGATITGDDATWRYEYTDTLTAVGRIKKAGFLGLGRQNYFVDAALKNPKAKIHGLKSFRIDEFKDRRFSLGPAIGYFPFVSGPQINKVQIGISLHYDVIRF